MTWLYITLGAIVLCALAVYIAVEYFFSVAIKRMKDEPRDFADVLHQRLSGTEREYLLRDISLGKRFIREHPHEDVSIVSRDGLTLRGRLYVSNGDAATVIFVHGYKSAPEVDFPVLARRFYGLGCNVLLIDHRTSGKSDGKYYGFGVLERCDVEGWCRFVTRRFGDGAELFLFGCSMGSATVLMASDLPFVREHVSGIIADCPYNAPEEEFRYILDRDYHLPPFPLIPLTSRLCKRRAGWAFDERTACDSVSVTDVPILLIHGTADRYVPARFSVDIYESRHGVCELLLIDGASHGYSFYQDPTRYLAKVDEFMKKHAQRRVLSKN